MSQRFFVESPIVSDTATLVDAEAHHLIHVMRAGSGDQVTLFDGCGAEFSARVAKLGRSHVELAVLSRLEISRELPFELTLGVALPRGDRHKWLVEKATELGVTRLVPLVTQRSVVEPGSGAIEKLRRVVIESAKQCGRNRLMEIERSHPWAEFLAAATVDSLRMIAHPTAEVCDPADSTLLLPAVGRPTFAAIGPEGGFTDTELADTHAEHATRISLGFTTLRIETAAVMAAGFVRMYAQSPVK